MPLHQPYWHLFTGFSFFNSETLSRPSSILLVWQGVTIGLQLPLQPIRASETTAYPLPQSGVWGRSKGACVRESSVWQRELRVWSQEKFTAVLVLPWSSCEIMNKSLKFSDHHFPHPSHRDGRVSFAFFTDLLKASNEILCVIIIGTSLQTSVFCSTSLINRNADQSHNDISPHTRQNGYHQKAYK